MKSLENRVLKTLSKVASRATSRAFREASRANTGVLFIHEGKLYRSYIDRIEYVRTIKNHNRKIAKNFKLE